MQDSPPDLKAGGAHHCASALTFIRRMFPHELRDVLRDRCGRRYGHSVIVLSYRPSCVSFAEARWLLTVIAYAR
jgi:hypothetical protein